MRAGERRDDAARHRLPDAERIADGKHEIAHFQTVRVGELDDRELSALGIEAEHGEVGVLVLEHDLGRELAPVRQSDGDLGLAASLDDVIVGDDEAALIDQHAGAERVLDALARDAEPLAEQLPEERVIAERRHHLLDPVLHIDIDHGGRGSLHHRGEGLLDRDLALGHGALLGVGRDRSARHNNVPGDQSRDAKFT